MILQFFFCVVEGAFLLGVWRFPQGFWVIFCGEFVVVECKNVVLRCTFFGAKDFPLFSNLFLGVNCDQKDVGRVVSCGRDLEGLIVRDGEGVAQG